MSASNIDHATGLASSASPYVPPIKNLVVTAIAAGDLKMLVSGIKEDGLAQTLARTGPFTIFAPTDAVFKKLAPGALKAPLKDTAKFKAVLSYHRSRPAAFGLPRALQAGIVRRDLIFPNG